MKKAIIIILAFCFSGAAVAQDSCQITSLPYFNDFENEPYFESLVTSYANAFPHCWTRINDAIGTGDYYPYIIGHNPAFLIRGSRSMYWRHSTGNYAAYNLYAVMPAVDRSLADNISDLTLSFYAKTTATEAPFPMFIIGVMTQRSDTSTFEPVDTVIITSTPTLYIVNLASYTGHGKYIAFRCPRTSETRMATLDDVYLNLTSQWCDPPADLWATSTDTSVTMYWSANGGSSFTVVLNDSVVTGVTDTFYTFNGLDDSTVYSFSVASECQWGNSPYLSGSIQTECSPLTYDDLPFFEDFEVYGCESDATLSPCWHRGLVGSIGIDLPRLTRLNIDDDTVALSIGASNYYYSWAALPRLDNSVDVSGLEVSFMLKRPNAGVIPIPGTRLVVGVTSNISQISTFVPVDTIDLSDAPVNSLHHITVRFENYTGTGKYITFRPLQPETSIGNSVNIDNVRLQLASPCPTPQNVRVTRITADSVYATWDYDVHADSCLVYVGAPGFDTALVVPQHVSGNSAAIGNLYPDIDYELLVVALCNGIGSYSSHPARFHTLCAPLTQLPFVEDFEGIPAYTSEYYGGVNNLPHCWLYFNDGIASDGAGYPIVHNAPGYARSGNNAMRFNTTCSPTPPDFYGQPVSYTDQIAILPLTDSTVYPIHNLQVSFGFRIGQNYYTPKILMVGVMSDPTDTSSFVPVSTITSINTHGYEFHTVGFANYTGPHGHVAFKAPVYTPMMIVGGANQFYIDDITLEEIPNGCPDITEINSQTTAAAALLTWDYNSDFGSPIGFNVSYRNNDDTSGVTTDVFTTETELLLTGLGVDSTYWVSVEPQCLYGTGTPGTALIRTQRLTCANLDTIGTPTDTITLGNPGTNAGQWVPLSGGNLYSYSQQLFRAEEIPVSGPTTLSGIGFEYFNLANPPLPMTNANCSIYLAHTERPNMFVGDSSFVPYDQLQLVYTGALDFPANGWTYFQFNQGNFHYDGHSNLCLAVVDNCGTTFNSYFSFRFEAVVNDENMPIPVTLRSMCYGSTATPYTPVEMDQHPTSHGFSNYRTNTRFITGGAGDCLAMATCVPPILNIDTSVAGTYRLSWIPGYHETSWDVDYRFADTGTWVNAISGTSNIEYTLTMNELQYDTRYDFRITANCGDTTAYTIVPVLTLCSFIDIPFHYDFDDLPTGSSTEPAEIHCWHHLNNGAIYNGSPYITTYAHSGNRGLSFFGSTASSYGDYGVMVLPPVNTAEYSMNSLYVDVWAKAPAKIYVGVMTDPTDINTFSLVDSLVLRYDDNDWDLCEVSLSNYDGNGQYIALRANRGAGGGMIDDVTVTNMPMCRRVHDIKAHNVTTDSATISWRKGNNELEWELTVGDEIYYTSDTVFTVNNLVGDTRYDVVVRSICGEGDTSVPTFGYFYTPCYLLDSLPYMNDFENEPFFQAYVTSYYNAFPSCWRRLHDYRTANTYNYFDPYVTESSTYLIHGGKSLYWDRSGGPNKAYVVLPPIDLGVFTMDSLSLSFYAKNVYSPSGAPTQLIVGALANSTDTTSFEPVDTITLTTTSTLYTVRFENYAGTNNYIAILLPLYNNDRDVSIDDIYLTNQWCDAPSNLISTATNEDVTLRWNGNGVESFTIVLTADSVVYDSVNDVTYTVTGASDTITGVTDTVYTFHDLYESTVYNYIVATECHGHIGQSLSGSIQTECHPMTYDDLPYYEDFEAYGNNYQLPISPCWHRGGSLLINGFYQPRLTTLLLDADTVGLSFSASTMGHSFCWASLPRLDDSVDISSLEVSFLIKRPVSGFTPIPNTTLVVGVSTDIYSWYAGVPPAESDFVPVDTVDFSDQPVNTIHSASVRFDNYTGNGKYIVFLVPEPVSTTTNSNGFTLDNVTLAMANPCHTPEHVMVTRVTWDSLYATWDGDENASGWTVYIGTPGFDIGSVSPVFVSGNHIAIGNLSPDRDYELVVTADCGGSESGTSFPVAFHTHCAPINSLPFTEDFESAAGIPSYTTYAPGNTLPGCWMSYNNSIANNNFPLVHSDPSIAHSGNNAMYFSISNNSSTSVDQIAIMPLTDAALFPVADLQVSFWMRCAHGYNSYIVVGVMSDPTDSSTFVPISTVYTYSIELHNNTMLYRRFSVGFAGYSGPHGHIAFKAPSPVSTLIGVNTPYIDDVTIEQRTCSPIEGLHVVSLASDSITIAWVDTGANSSWLVEYDIANFTPGTGAVTPIRVFDTVYSLTGLDSGTVYHIYVYPDCPDSIGALYTFATTLTTTPTTLPFACGFSNEGTSGWGLLGGTQGNYWTVGDATGNPGRSLYITDDGTDNNYSGPASTVFATRTFHIDAAGDYAYCFDWKCNGEGTSDFLRAALVPAGTILTPGEWSGFDDAGAVPDGGIPLDGGRCLSGHDTWQYLSGQFTITAPGNYVWVFMWHNDGSGYNQAPAAIDNVCLRPNTCPMPHGLTGVVSADSISLTWVPGGGEGVWKVSLDNSSVIVTTPTYTFRNLATNQGHTVRVRAICSPGDTSLALTSLFAARRYRVTANANNPDFGNVTGGGMFYYGESTILSASPFEGYCFTRWSDGDTINPRSLQVTADTTLTATFEEEVGIGNVEAHQWNIDISPNPVKGVTTVTVTGVSGKVRIAVLDLMGREVISEAMECSAECAKSLDFEGLAGGTYFVRVTSESNAPLVKKLIVR